MLLAGGRGLGTGHTGCGSFSQVLPLSGVGVGWLSLGMLIPVEWLLCAERCE